MHQAFRFSVLTSKWPSADLPELTKIFPSQIPLILGTGILPIQISKIYSAIAHPMFRPNDTPETIMGKA